MLSFNIGKPIAKIIEGKLKNEIIYLDTDEKCCVKHSKKCERRPCCEECTELSQKIGKEMKINGKLQPIPDITTRSVALVCGPSGSGKSTYASEYLKMYRALFPKNPIYVFSRLDKDPVIDQLRPYRIKIDEELIENPIDIIQEMHDCIVLFDDTDTIQDDKLKKIVSKLKNDILETGRHNNIYVIITSHLINGNDKKDTRTMLNECHSLTVFPKSGSSYAITYALKNYFGFNNQLIKRILESDSRWVTINKTYPQYVMTQNEIYIT